MKKWRATQNRKASEVEDFSPPESPEVGISVVEDHVVLRRICMTRRLPAGAEAMRVREKIGKSVSLKHNITRREEAGLSKSM